MLSSSIKGNLERLMIHERKLDSTLPSDQLIIEGYGAPVRFDRSGRGGGIILYIREDIPTRLLTTSLPKNFEGFFVELSLCKKEILMCCSYNPAKSNISSHVSIVGRSLDSYMSSHGSFLVIGDLNSEISEMAMSEFCETYNLQNLVKDPTCYKNPSKPTCIDLILTNFPKSFQHTQTIETGLSDFHKLTLTVLKTHFPRLKPNIVNYRDYKGYVNDYIRSELLQEINSSDSDLTNFKDLQYILQRVLDKHAPLKKRYVRANQQNFMDKELNQAIMVRSKLRNKYLKSKSETDKQRYNKQRNYCVKLLRLKKQKDRESLDISKVTDNKTLRKTICPLFSNKSYLTNSRITLLESGAILSDKAKVADTFNEFFSNVIKELKIEKDDNLLTL